MRPMPGRAVVLFAAVAPAPLISVTTLSPSFRSPATTASAAASPSLGAARAPLGGAGAAVTAVATGRAARALAARGSRRAGCPLVSDRRRRAARGGTGGPGSRRHALGGLEAQRGV